jgi:hypothetical protein
MDDGNGGSLNVESITRELANEYVREAYLVPRRRKIEQIALEQAAELNRIGMNRPTFEIFAAAASQPKETEMIEVLAWQP